MPVVAEDLVLRPVVEQERAGPQVHGDEWEIESEVRQLGGPEFGARG